MERFWEELGTFENGIEHVNAEIERTIGRAEPDFLYDASSHLLRLGGKRIRPALVELSFRAVNRDGRSMEYMLPIAVAVELIHTATIIHDDIIDKNSVRRGARTVNAKWGDDTALLAGDLIFSRAFGLVGLHEKKELSKIISEACVKLAEGEVLETYHTGDVDMTEEVYLEIIERKTASLFEASTRCGALLGEGTDEEVEALTRYGYLIGIGFQMTDDVLDIIAGQEILGKPPGTDIALGNVTLATLHSLGMTDGAEKKELERIVKKRKNTKKEISRALEIITASGSIKYSLKRARSFIERAKERLDILEDTEAKRRLQLIADRAITREF